MTFGRPRQRQPDGFSHDLLLHDSDLALVQGTPAFVQQGLASGGQVLVHSTEDQVAMLREGPGLSSPATYGLDQDLYQSPIATLFRYQRVLEDSSGSTALWATGTVPARRARADPGLPGPGTSRWSTRLLGPYAFHGLCTYDTQALPDARHRRGQGDPSPRRRPWPAATQPGLPAAGRLPG